MSKEHSFLNSILTLSSCKRTNPREQIQIQKFLWKTPFHSHPLVGTVYWLDTNTRVFRIPRWIPPAGGGEQNGWVNLALRAGLILSNPESVGAEARSLGSCAMNTAEQRQAQMGDWTVTQRGGWQSEQLIREAEGWGVDTTHWMPHTAVLRLPGWRTNTPSTADNRLRYEESGLLIPSCCVLVLNLCNPSQRRWSEMLRACYPMSVW